MTDLAMTDLPRPRSCSLAALAALAALFAVACTASRDGSDPGDGVGAGEETEATEDELRGSCTYPRRYFATLRGRACADVAGRRGAWIASPLTADAPAGAPACTFDWVGERWSRADRAALAASVAEHETLTPACGEGANPVLGGLREIPYVDVWSQAGSVGCDVCGLISKRRLWVVLPPEKVPLRQISVQLSDGTGRSFQLEAPAGARAVSVELPPPPPGLAYAPGTVHVY